MSLLFGITPVPSPSLKPKELPRTLGKRKPSLPLLPDAERSKLSKQDDGLDTLDLGPIPEMTGLDPRHNRVQTSLAPLTRGHTDSKQEEDNVLLSGFQSMQFRRPQDLSIEPQSPREQLDIDAKLQKLAEGAGKSGPFTRRSRTHSNDLMDLFAQLDATLGKSSKSQPSSSKPLSRPPSR